MTATDRMSDLNSRREITDRVGQTVILGNAIGSGELNIIAAAVMSAGGKSEVHVPYTMTAIANIEWFNASFGVWAVYVDIDATASVSFGGGSRWNSRLLGAAAATLGFGSNASNLLGIQVFTATAAYTPTAGTVSIFVEALGGGGGGGAVPAPSGSTAGGGGGGGAGVLAKGRITSGFSGVTVTVGAGGAGGVAGNNNGTAGGSTSFGSVLIAGGGAGGSGDPTSGPAHFTSGGIGGSASGSSSIAGFIGQTGYQGYHATSLAVGGGGAASGYGSGGPQTEIFGGASAPGNAGSGFGAGGSGACCHIGGGSRAGGNGTAGICIIYEYNV